MGKAPLVDVHALYGPAADLVLYKKPETSAGIVLGATVAYYLLELSGLTYVTLLSSMLAVLVLAALMWAAASSVFTRIPAPPVLMLQIQDDHAAALAKAAIKPVNSCLFLVAKLMSGKHIGLSLRWVGGLYAVSKVASWFHFLTYAYAALLVSFTLPKLYVTFQREADEVLAVAVAYAKELYATGELWFHANVLSKMAPQSVAPSGSATGTTTSGGDDAKDSAKSKKTM